MNKKSTVKPLIWSVGFVEALVLFVIFDQVSPFYLRMVLSLITGTITGIAMLLIIRD